MLKKEVTSLFHNVCMKRKLSASQDHFMNGLDLRGGELYRSISISVGNYPPEMRDGESKSSCSGQLLVGDGICGSIMTATAHFTEGLNNMAYLQKAEITFTFTEKICLCVRLCVPSCTIVKTVLLTKKAATPLCTL